MSEEPGLTGLDVVCWVSRGRRVVSEVYVTRHAATLLSPFSDEPYYYIAHRRLKRTRNKYSKNVLKCLKRSLWLTTWSARGEAEIGFHAFLTSALDGCEYSPSCFYIVTPCIHFSGRLSPRTGMSVMAKRNILPWLGIESRTSFLLPVTLLSAVSTLN